MLFTAFALLTAYPCGIHQITRIPGGVALTFIYTNYARIYGGGTDERQVEISPESLPLLLGQTLEIRDPHGACMLTVRAKDGRPYIQMTGWMAMPDAEPRQFAENIEVP